MTSAVKRQNGYDADAEIAKADNYPLVRTMTVGTSPLLPSYHPVPELQASPQLPWSVAGKDTVGLGNWTATSAVCWYYAKTLFDKTNVPQGIISSNWGGTFIQSWIDNSTNAKCSAVSGVDGKDNHTGGQYSPPAVAMDASRQPWAFSNTTASAARGTAGQAPSPFNGYGVLFNSMIYPFTVGPMSLKSFIWFQGEANCGQPAYYACAQPAMVSSWRKYFNNPNAFFGYVELEPSDYMSANIVS